MPDPDPARRVFIFDDDPTGTQTSSDVDVLLDLSSDSIGEFVRTRQNAVFLLTNTRGLAEREAVDLVRRTKEVIHHALVADEAPYALVLRGDSTLRGHIFAEIDAIAQQGSAILFVPAFPEGGRATINGVHYLQTPDGHIPVGDTEYAADPVFGYSNSNLVDWVAEVGDGRRATSIALAELRSSGPDSVKHALINAAPGEVIIPDAETRGDLEITLEGVRGAERHRPVQIRCAATFASLYAGLSPRLIDRVPLPPRGTVLLVCGSYTKGATTQVDHVIKKFRPPVFEVPTAAMRSDDPAAMGRGIGDQLRAACAGERLVVLMTPRTQEHTADSLDSGARMMTALTSAVQEVASHVVAVVAKGGITSADVAKRGLHARRARVVGQIGSGIPLWSLPSQAGPMMPYVVVPGNVGDEDALLRVLNRLEFGTPGSGLSSSRTDR
ncbi:MAG: four-carbon acid sugar kinase family protein [Dehalococcoidia bacterium]